MTWAADRQPPLRRTDSNNLMIDYARGTSNSIDELAANLRRHLDLRARP